MAKKEDIKCDEWMRGGEHELSHRAAQEWRGNTNELHGKEKIGGFYEVSIMSTTYSL